MMHWEISDTIAVICEFISISIFNISAMCKNKRKIVILHIFCNIFDVITNTVKGAKSGLASASANIAKNVTWLFIKNDSLVYLFSFLRIGLLILGYEGILTILFIILEIAGVISLCRGTVDEFKWITFLRQIVWTIYDFVFINFVGGLLTATGVVSMVLGLYKDSKDRDKSI